MADLKSLSALYNTLTCSAALNADGGGGAVVDGYIADILSVAALPYTSNNTDAQTLLPSGWSWGTTDAGNACCVRISDGVKTTDLIVDGNVVLLPNPVARCLAAVSALFFEARSLIVISSLTMLP